MTATAKNGTTHTKTSALFFRGRRVQVVALFSVVMLFGLLLSLTIQEPPPSSPEPQYDVAKTVSYGFTVKNTSSSVVKGADLWVYAPVQKTSSQYCCTQLTASHSYELVKDSVGNQALHFRFDLLPPYSQTLIRVTAESELAKTPNFVQPADLSLFLRDEPGIETGHPEIAKLAQSLKTDDEMSTAKNLYKWVTRQLEKRDYTRDVKGALYALKQRKGDCTETAYLFVALARAAGIPSRPIGGYVVEVSGVLQAADYHSWAEFYVDGAWRLADPYKAVFDSDYEYYVATRVIAQTNNNFSAHRYWHSGNGLSVTMN